MYKNIIFDFDGTIADSKKCSFIATKKAFLDCGLKEPSDNQIEYYMGIPIEKSFDLMSSVELKTKERNELIALFRRNYKEIEDLYLEIYDNMLSQLETLHKKAKLFVVSSKKTDVLKRNLKILKIEGLFLEVVGSDKVKEYKPSPDGILYILNKYNLNRDETIYIGDAIFDIQMAKNAGVSSCAVTWGSHSEEKLKLEIPDFIITNVNQLEFEG
ncbi:HAD family hydrolase [Staphylococcus caprae]|uniref:HAD family hydrolase n=1 Tax=Staphylococcus caprae TaxID=29380 RepID=UPI000CD080D8|nr:HAD family hydrolase [Staphylococcus caprae]POA02595.1 haloacid dehalogenase [Staphylococcus caprae]SUL89619.1 putative haloacid dehydrogenase-like hydrolase [Staphylococcus caprae]